MTEDEEDEFGNSEPTSVQPSHKFDKKKLREMIVSNGGQVLEQYPSHTDPTPIVDRKLVTVSDHRCLTMTYILSLVDCVPIVSHVYIIDCLTSSSLLDRQAYLLPAGFSSLLMQEVEQGQDCTDDLRVNDCLLPMRGTRQRKEEDPVLPGRRILAGLHVLVISLSSDFTDVWQSVLDSLGASVTKRSSTIARLDKIRLPDVVVTDNKAPKPICQDLAARSELPVVSTKWIVQCAVNNARVAYNNFKYLLPAPIGHNRTSLNRPKSSVSSLPSSSLVRYLLPAPIGLNMKQGFGSSSGLQNTGVWKKNIKVMKREKLSYLEAKVNCFDH